MEVSEHAPGSFCWMELSTSDGEGAKRFYSSLFGWEPNDMPMGEGMVYTMLMKGGKHVGALYQDNKPGVPPYWGSYVSVQSADAAAAKAKELGGQILAEPFDVMEVGRMAVIQDPQGAVFCVWQPKSHIGMQVVDEVGAFCWDELNTNDTGGAIRFYRGLFGWGIKGNEDGSSEYTEFQNGGRSIGGMMAIQPEWGPVPPHWLPYFQVADCDASSDRANSLGGEVKGPMDIPGVGRFSIIKDPQGAHFAIVKLG